MVRFAVSPTPKQASSAERFAAQLALSRVHPNLIALDRTPGGYAPPRDETLGWFELRAQRGFAGYGLSRALRMLLDVLAGLSALEDTRSERDQPFVHGELVPAMLRVDPTGTTRLVPLAPWHWSAPGTLPVPERFGHLAPERLLGDVIDARADVFSAGVLLWEALAGRRLFETDSVDGIVMRLMGDKITLPELPPELSWAVPLKAVAMRALSADPEQRYAHCGELTDAIRAVAGDHVATHADVANFLRSPAPAPRGSFSDEPPTLPRHHSSLSALVSPLQASERPAAHEAEPVGYDPPRPERRVSRAVWAIAAISCVVGAAFASGPARDVGSSRRMHGAAPSAPVVVLPMNEPDVRPSPTPSPTLAPVPSAPLVPAASSSSAIELPLPPAENHDPKNHDQSHDPGSKPQKAGTTGKAPKVRAPAKSPRSVDKAAAKYGI